MSSNMLAVAVGGSPQMAPNTPTTPFLQSPVPLLSSGSSGTPSPLNLSPTATDRTETDRKTNGVGKSQLDSTNNGATTANGAAAAQKPAFGAAQKSPAKPLLKLPACFAPLPDQKDKWWSYDPGTKTISLEENFADYDVDKVDFGKDAFTLVVKCTSAGMEMDVNISSTCQRGLNRLSILLLQNPHIKNVYYNPWFKIKGDDSKVNSEKCPSRHFQDSIIECMGTLSAFQYDKFALYYSGSIEDAKLLQMLKEERAIRFLYLKSDPSADAKAVLLQQLGKRDKPLHISTYETLT